MISRPGNQRSYPSSRRFSSTNPFRMSMIDTGNVSPSSEPLQDWMRSSSPSIEEPHEIQYVHASYHSAGSSRVNSPLDGDFRYVFLSYSFVLLLWGKQLRGRGNGFHVSIKHVTWTVRFCSVGEETRNAKSFCSRTLRLSLELVMLYGI